MGFHTALAYSDLGRTGVVYAGSFSLYPGTNLTEKSWPYLKKHDISAWIQHSSFHPCPEMRKDKRYIWNASSMQQDASFLGPDVRKHVN